jgi:predicted kinase
VIQLHPDPERRSRRHLRAVRERRQPDGLSRAGDRIHIAATTDAKLLLSSGEPVVGHGPFDMNTRAEIQQAFEDSELGPHGGDRPLTPTSITSVVVTTIPQ